MGGGALPALPTFLGYLKLHTNVVNIDFIYLELIGDFLYQNY